MANTNSENPLVGKRFQELAQKSFNDYYKDTFVLEAGFPIGDPAKIHKFDLCNLNKTIVIECKCYTWTVSGNVPSAKLMGIDEAIFYFGFLNNEMKKILCMMKSTFPGKTETLAEYYVRLHGHLLGDVQVFELDKEGKIRVVRSTN